LKEEFPIQIIGKAFLLRPDIPPEGRPRPRGDDKPTDNELREPLRSSAIDAGLSKMKRSPFIPYSIPALEATEYAKEQDRFMEFHRACYQALWEKTQDIGKLDVIESIAGGCGLDWQELGERLKSGYYREEVMRQYLEGRRNGFQGIPGFIIANARFTGAAPYEMFRVAAQRAMVLVRPESPSHGKE